MTTQVYLTDNCHFNPDIYSEPLKWDPDRYATGRAEDKKGQYAYLGWGVGRHSCLGMTVSITSCCVDSYLLTLIALGSQDGGYHGRRIFRNSF